MNSLRFPMALAASLLALSCSGVGERDNLWDAEGTAKPKNLCLDHKVKDLRNGDYQALFTTTGKTAVDITASVAAPVTGNPLRHVLLVPATTRVKNDGTSAVGVTVVTVDAKERARIMAMMYVAVIVITSPFGWIAGLLSQANRSLPFILNIILFTVSAILVYITIRRVKPGETVTA